MTVSVVVPARRGQHFDTSSLKGYDQLIIERAPGGVARARNLGAEKATGDVLVFIDVDTIAVGDLSKLDPSRADYWTAEWFTPFAKRPYTILGLYWANMIPRIFRYPFTIGPFIAVTRAAFDAVGGFRLDVLFEDLDLGLRLWQHDFRLGFAPGVRVHIIRPFLLPSNGAHTASSRARLGLRYAGRK